MSSRAEEKTTREGGADRKNTEGDGEAAAGTAVASNRKERRREHERTETKKERGEHTDIRHIMLSSDLD
jgi:hypothetical protein